MATSRQIVNVPTTLEQKLFGTPVTSEIPLSRNELKTVFYVGRKLELIGCYLPMATPQMRTVKAHRSYGYDMTKEDGRVSRLDFETGQRIIGISPIGNGFTEVKIVDAQGNVAAHYRLVSEVNNG